MSNYERLIMIGVFLSVVGLIVIVAGLVLSSLLVGNGGSALFAGIVMIGPIPIIFGTDRTAVLIGVVGAVILMVIMFAILVLARRRVAVKLRKDDDRLVSATSRLYDEQM